ncbi:hypothetical protein OQX63_17225 [Pedobacter sp. PF22-3]|uniref:hypothetical protein n=1 Tax=Pedobacter sp. PF22-3 TaxID=2994467 RepID=UPI0022452A41|nr:hypothetical protein [Pedobacter sp. PF22-3]MCX2495235.1 hypothetical protein [Pedobacter sp. PF22-3]
MKGKEGQNRRGKFYKRKSQNIWNVVRVNEKTGEKFYIVSLVTKNPLTSYWIYYRFLTNYDSPDHRDVLEKFQDIDEFYILSALEYLDFDIPQYIKHSVDKGCKLLDSETVLKIRAEILLDVFVKAKFYKIPFEKILKPKKTCFNNRIFDEITIQTFYEIEKRKSGFQKVLPRRRAFCQENVCSAIESYFSEINLSNFSEAFNSWSKMGRKIFWSNDINIFSEFYRFHLFTNKIIPEEVKIKPARKKSTAYIVVTVEQTEILIKTPQMFRRLLWPIDKDTKVTWPPDEKRIMEVLTLDDLKKWFEDSEKYDFHTMYEFIQEGREFMFWLNEVGYERERIKSFRFWNRRQVVRKQFKFDLEQEADQPWQISGMHNIEIRN